MESRSVLTDFTDGFFHNQRAGKMKKTKYPVDRDFDGETKADRADEISQILTHCTALAVFLLHESLFLHWK